MTNMTLAIPEELHRVMRRHSEIKWSEVARQALWAQAEKLAVLDKILAKSRLTEKDALGLGRKINEGIARRHRLLR